MQQQQQQKKQLFHQSQKQQEQIKCNQNDQGNKQLSQSQNSYNKQQNKIKILSVDDIPPLKQQSQMTEQQYHFQEQQQQQLIKEQDSNKKNIIEQSQQETLVSLMSTLNTEDYLTETMFMTQIISCSRCLSSLQQNNITLPCLHYYHQACFNEMVDNFLKQGNYRFFQCKCNYIIPYKTLIKLTSTNNKTVEDLVIQQQAWLISVVPLTIRSQIPGKNNNINNIKEFIREQIQKYKTSLNQK